MNGLTRTCFFFSVVFLSTCASLPENTGNTESYAYRDTRNTQLGQAIEPLTREHPGKSGLVPLAGGVDAFTARYVLANVAQRSIDAQYYLWHDDLTGKLLVHALLEAADRGVRVRLLLDDINMAGKDRALAALQLHPNIEVRLFNPFVNRNFRSIDIITDFSRVNRRMHNKSYTVDVQATIVGGRNIGDEYFDANPSADIQDFDFLAIGAAVSEVSSQFDLYWNSKFSFPVDRLLLSDAEEPITDRKAKLDQHVREMSNTVFIDAVRKSEFLKNVQSKNLSFFWEQAQVIYDEPDKIEQHEDNTELHLSSKLDPLITGTQQEIIIVSPYLIPGENGIDRIRKASERGVKFRILTNSLASTDVPLVHASYSNYRTSLIEAGVELYEMKPTYRSKEKAKLMDVSSRASLHSKVYVFDRKNVFVGSYNLDPRSTKLNTEMGIYVADTEMAELFISWWERNVEKLAFKLSLQHDDNKPGSKPRLLWMDMSQDPIKVYDDEPLVGAWEKFKSNFFSFWPIEGQL